MKLTLTSRFDRLPAETDMLLQAGDGAAVLTRSTTIFEYLPSGTGAGTSGYHVRLTGTALTYAASGRPTGGKIDKVQILTDDGKPVATFSGFWDRGTDSLIGYYDHAFRDADWGGNGAWAYLMRFVDRIYGTRRSDHLVLPDRLDVVQQYDLGGGDDVLHFGERPWSGHLEGGAGFDTLSYAMFEGSDLYDARLGLTFQLETPGQGTATAIWHVHDSFAGFERLLATRLADRFEGSSGNDTAAGLRGNDTLDGGLGTQDRLLYDSDAEFGGMGGIRADLAGGRGRPRGQGQVVDGFGTVDVVRGFEQVYGTRFDDEFRGSAGAETFAGGDGADAYAGRAGLDTIDFGAPVAGDRAGAVHLDLRLASGQVIDDGFGHAETVSGIERFIGGAGNDTLEGNRGDQSFQGGAGSDLLAGHGGRDTFLWQTSPAPGEIDRVTDFRSHGPAEQVDVIGLVIPGFEHMRNMLVLVNGRDALDPIGTLLYDRRVETLFWDSDGSGPAERTAIVVLEGVRSLAPMNFDLVL